MLFMSFLGFVACESLHLSDAAGHDIDLLVRSYAIPRATEAIQASP
jgi:hypothetical protein